MARKNTIRALDNFFAGTADTPSNQGSAVWTDGERIYSYGTALLERGPQGVFLLNDTRYSVTTSTHQGGLRAALAGAFTVVTLDNVPQDTRDLARWDREWREAHGLVPA